MENINKIRNFCIIAHIDHGKSTLADRLLEKTQTIKITEGQMLDDMDLERERGITIKSHAIQMEYKAKDGDTYILNLIDTPGHVDFSYEVSRSIAACEGALLVVDATQGVQAQTISNLYMAIEHDLEIIPVINKIDMPSAMPEEVEDEIVDLIGCKHEDILRASGKTGEGVEDVLEAVVNRVPAPKGDDKAPLQALIFDSVFNSFRGIIAYFKIENGVIRKGDKVKFFNTGMEYDADEIGVLKMDMIPRKELGAGEVGYIISGIKNATEVKVGDTITHIARPCEKAIAGFRWSLPAFILSILAITRICVPHWRSCSSTMLRLPSLLRVPLPWASVSDADSSVCSTWRLYRSVWTVSSIWMSSPPYLTYPIWYMTSKVVRKRYITHLDCQIQRSSTISRSHISELPSSQLPIILVLS